MIKIKINKQIQDKQVRKIKIDQKMIQLQKQIMMKNKKNFTQNLNLSLLHQENINMKLKISRIN